VTRKQLNQLKRGDVVIRERFGHQMIGIVEQVEPDCVFVRFPGGRACFRKGYDIRHLRLDTSTPAEKANEFGSKG
jgi:hypothetical protein